MKRLVYVCGLVLFAASFAVSQRLPELAAPEHYTLSFAPDFNHDNFSGDETIAVRVLKPTSEIVLNAVDIDFKDVSISSGGGTQKAKVTPEKDKEMVALAVDQQLQPGPATIHIGYSGSLNDQLRGFYLGHDQRGQKYAVTQFEATDARRAFPSFDEPAYKATFDITVTALKGQTVISNTPVVSDKPGPGPDQHTVHFAMTPKMSSYLVAMAVGNFEYIEGESDGIPIRIYTLPGKKHLGAFALATAKQCLHYYDDYFGIKYPFKKLDLIGLPDFSAGAMENTGAITFREVLLLVDENHSSIALRKEIAEVIAHEMAHQWFGDLVTMQWWDDIWLNEGFATWMESKPVEAWKPEWNVQLDDVNETGNALNLDALQNTRPIHQVAETPAQIQELFDGIAYGKAAAVLRMLETYLGKDAFRKGVNAYISAHAYGNSTAIDFWSALAKASQKPVDRIMPTFVEQPGAPIVDVKTQCRGSSTQVALSQRRYFYDPALFDRGNDELWQVPVCLKSGGSGNGQEKCQLLTQRETTVNMPRCSQWVIANASGFGYYRSGYQADAVHAMSGDLESALTPAERITLLRDTWASVRVNKLKIGDYLAVARGLQADRNRAVLEELTSRLDYIGRYLVNDTDRGEYQQWVRTFLTPMANDLGWQPTPGENPDRTELRPIILYTLGYTGRDQQTLAQARKLAEEALQNGSSVDPSLLTMVLHLAAFDGNAELYDKIMSHMKSGQTPEQYYVYLGSLTYFSDPALLRRTLEFVIGPEVRNQDRLGIIDDVMTNPAGEKIAWNFVKEHWDEINKVEAGFGSAEVIAGTSSFCDAGLRDDVQDFFNAHPVPSAERRLKQSLERINYCVDLRSQQSPLLFSWLQQHASTAGE